MGRLPGRALLEQILSECPPGPGAYTQRRDARSSSYKGQGRHEQEGVCSSGSQHGAPRKRDGVDSSDPPLRKGKKNALLAFRELEGTEGVHLTLLSEDPKINEIFATELMADA
eukprot:504313-Hanusia_phi.AAC.1